MDRIHPNSSTWRTMTLIFSSFLPQGPLFISANISLQLSLLATCLQVHGESNFLWCILHKQVLVFCSVLLQQLVSLRSRSAFYKVTTGGLFRAMGSPASVCTLTPNIMCWHSPASYVPTSQGICFHTRPIFPNIFFCWCNKKKIPTHKIYCLILPIQSFGYTIW